MRALITFLSNDIFKAFDLSIVNCPKYEAAADDKEELEDNSIFLATSFFFC